MTKDLVEVCAGVTEFLNRSSKLIASKAEDDFNQGAWRDFQDQSISSPIEQYLYAALRLLQRLDDIPTGDPVRVDDEFFMVGLDITPQFKVGKYAADFHISYGEYPNWKDKSQITRTVIVECDSQRAYQVT